ncbi:hypothetical protein DAPPUDRAFT_98699 [Daphnia pulex]|uniref:Major facilitator superfamily (MFS) profile domain-containing protein n=1 Tax=Daphnia pulex TaxID=6669 RepID=E9G5K0_DAPPU|nr:hypothetical protein DAPPUDRAFT_98699 [Daphnia pulex]|eukprot:EFX85219.1 hypothetical protein DAPPUDRAFT_98699 [Daphnia pulex]
MKKEKLCAISPTSRSPDIDAGWAWIIAVAALFASAISSGVYFTFSMYFPILLNEFQASRAATAWVGSLNNGIYMLAGPIATFSIRRIGCRWTVMIGGMTSMIGLALSSVAPSLTMLFFTYGGITAFGLCLNYTSWIVAISDSFNKKHAIAFSLSQSGVGLGIFIFGPLFSFLITEFGWRGALLITGACTLQLTCLGALIFPLRNPKEIEITNLESHPLTKEAKCTDEEIKEILHNLNSEVAAVVDEPTTASKWKNHCATMLHLSCFFCNSPFYRYYIIMLSTMGIGDLICRLVIGPLITVWKLDVTKLYAISQIACAITIASFPTVVNGVQMIIQGFLFSVTFGSLVPRAIFGSENLNRIFGVSMFFGGIGILIGPPIAGLIVDITPGRSYWLAFVFASVMELLSAIATIGALFFANRK